MDQVQREIKKIRCAGSYGKCYQERKFVKIKKKRGRPKIGNVILDRITITEEMYNALLIKSEKMKISLNDLRRLSLQSILNL